MKKQEIINALIEDDIKNIENFNTGFYWWIEQILANGFIGYNNQSIEQLKQEYEERELENQLAVKN